MEPSGTAAGDGSIPADFKVRRQLAFVRFLAFLSAAVLALLVLANRVEVTQVLAADLGDLLLWALIISAVNLLHFDGRSVQFTLDLPVLLSVGALYPPAVASLLAFVASVDVREFSGGVSPSRALYNRSQVALSLFASSLVFHATSSLRDAWQDSILGVAAAFAVFFVLNAAFVATFVWARKEGSWLDGVMRLWVGRPIEYLLTYVGYGVLALVLARIFGDIGWWAVFLFLIPIVAAHLALVRADELRALTERLKNRERLLERLSDRIVEEREDERLRIASDLHDEVLQNVTKIWMQAGFVQQAVTGETQLTRDVRELVANSEETLGSLREVISDLRRSPLGRGGLVATVEQLVRDLRLDWGRRIIFTSGPEVPNLAPSIQLTAYQVIRESLMNALKHSEALDIRVSLDLLGSELVASIADDGVGFEPTRVDDSQHFGLGLTRERVTRLDGQLLLETSVGKGTRVEARIPLGGAGKGGNSTKTRT